MCSLWTKQNPPPLHTFSKLAGCTLCSFSFHFAVLKNFFWGCLTNCHVMVVLLCLCFSVFFTVYLVWVESLRMRPMDWATMFGTVGASGILLLLTLSSWTSSLWDVELPPNNVTRSCLDTVAVLQVDLRPQWDSLLQGGGGPMAWPASTRWRPKPLPRPCSHHTPESDRHLSLVRKALVYQNWCFSHCANGPWSPPLSRFYTIMWILERQSYPQYSRKLAT